MKSFVENGLASSIEGFYKISDEKPWRFLHLAIKRPHSKPLYHWFLLDLIKMMKSNYIIQIILLFF